MESTLDYRQKDKEIEMDIGLHVGKKTSFK